MTLPIALALVSAALFVVFSAAERAEGSTTSIVLYVVGGALLVVLGVLIGLARRRPG